MGQHFSYRKMSLSDSPARAAIRISVVIPVYNLQAFIAKAIESVINQTRKADQIIVVDDGSTDSTLKIVAQYLDFVTCVGMGSNSGVLPAIMRAFEYVDGDIVSFLDGDDIWMPEKLALVERSFLDDNNLMFVTHNYECINSRGEPLPYSSDDTHINMIKLHNQNLVDCVKRSRAYKKAILGFKGYWLGSAWSMRMSAFNRVCTFS
jgi:glycosyltransferase involved in cell wall biosynthesis